MIKFIKNFIKLHFMLGIARSSANLAYYLIFSFFPLLIFLNSTLAIINIKYDDIEQYIEFLPDNVSYIIEEYLAYISGGESFMPFIVGLGLLLYTFARFVNSLMHIINEIYGVKSPKRSMISSIFFTFAMMLSVYAILILVVLGDTILNFVGGYIKLPVNFALIFNLIRYIFPILYFFAIILLLYKFIPRQKISYIEALPGAVYSICGTIVLSVGFGIYVAYFSNYSIIYGSLSTVMLLMLWLYLSSAVIIGGSLINKMLMDKKEFL